MAGGNQISASTVRRWVQETLHLLAARAPRLDRALLQDDPNRLWRPAEIAAHFGDVTLHTMYRQLSRWANTGLIHKLGPGLYAATTWTSTPCHQHKRVCQASGSVP
ncbi:hypothetical protein [Streptomyces cadmiisoli]|uniref:hypothetical protein n=1 Tax=Streptomyces cadmiisoli TaxID=2184053 RepID=UPI00364976A7